MVLKNCVCNPSLLNASIAKIGLILSTNYSISIIHTHARMHIHINLIANEHNQLTQEIKV